MQGYITISFLRQTFLKASVALLSASVLFAADDAYARKPQKKEPAPQIQKVQKPVWGWESARMTAAFMRQADNSYKIEQLSEPLNPDKKLPIASLTKSMAALVILEAIETGKIHPDQMIPIHPDSRTLPDSKFAVVGLKKEWTEIPVKSALTQLLQLSSNTMAMNLAIAVSGSPENFVAKMNAKAREWNMHDTHFVNEHGLPVGDRKSEFTTANNMLILAAHMIPHLEVLRTYTNAPLTYWETPPVNPKNAKAVHNADKMALIDQGVLLKTATINECQSLLSVKPVDGAFVADIQLCAPKYTRFKRAVIALQDAATKVSNMLMSNAMAAPQSSPQAHPSEP